MTGKELSTDCSILQGQSRRRNEDMLPAGKYVVE